MKKTCGLNVHKDSIFVCVLDESEKIYQNKFGALSTELEQMASILSEYGVEEVCMESTSIYWIPVWRVLEPYFDLKLSCAGSASLSSWKTCLPSPELKLVRQQPSLQSWALTCHHFKMPPTSCPGAG